MSATAEVREHNPELSEEDVVAAVAPAQAALDDAVNVQQVCSSEQHIADARLLHATPLHATCSLQEADVSRSSGTANCTTCDKEPYLTVRVLPAGAAAADDPELQGAAG